MVLHNQEIILGEHHNDRNIYFSKNQWDAEDQDTHLSHCLASSNKSSSLVCSNLNPLQGVSMEKLIERTSVMRFNWEWEDITTSHVPISKALHYIHSTQSWRKDLKMSGCGCGCDDCGKSWGQWWWVVGMKRKIKTYLLPKRQHHLSWALFLISLPSSSVVIPVHCHCCCCCPLSSSSCCDMVVLVVVVSVGQWWVTWCICEKDD